MDADRIGHIRILYCVCLKICVSFAPYFVLTFLFVLIYLVVCVEKVEEGLRTEALLSTSCANCANKAVCRYIAASPAGI